MLMKRSVQVCLMLLGFNINIRANKQYRISVRLFLDLFSALKSEINLSPT
jgi:hypothetical protein